jgi:hypothetical protein
MRWVSSQAFPLRPEQFAEKLDMEHPAPKGAIDLRQLRYR